MITSVICHILWIERKYTNVTPFNSAHKVYTCIKNVNNPFCKSNDRRYYRFAVAVLYIYSYLCTIVCYFGRSFFFLLFFCFEKLAEKYLRWLGVEKWKKKNKKHNNRNVNWVYGFVDHNLCMHSVKFGFKADHSVKWIDSRAILHWIFYIYGNIHWNSFAFHSLIKRNILLLLLMCVN